jgi:hypothetical protein
MTGNQEVRSTDGELVIAPLNTRYADGQGPRVRFQPFLFDLARRRAWLTSSMLLI